MSMPVLTARGLVRAFAQVQASVRVLDGIDLTVASGEVVTISGPSGSGKSALLSVLCGFDKADAGSVHILGEPVTPTVAWQRCAVLPQSLGLADELTLAENVALPLLMTRDPDPQGRAGALLEELAIGELADRCPAQVSLGQRQRAALARALIARPTALLADEPTAHLDRASVPATLRLLRRAADDGTAVLIVTHDDDVHRIADRTLTLHQGRLITVSK
jgi:putative ABC transport system ATP-binding protein